MWFLESFDIWKSGKISRSAVKRYSRLLVELDEIEDDSQAEVLLRNYISEESVGYYRNLAMKELDEFVN